MNPITQHYLQKAERVSPNQTPSAPWIHQEILSNHEQNWYQRAALMESHSHWKQMQLTGVPYQTLAMFGPGPSDSFFPAPLYRPEKCGSPVICLSVSVWN